MALRETSKLVAVVSLLLAVFVFGSSVGVWAQEQDSTALGERLVRQWWEAMRARDILAIDRMLSAGFQSIHQDGARDRAEELELIVGLNFCEYTLTDFRVTREGATIIVTYKASVEETLAGTRTTTTPAPRMTIWIMTEAGWRLLAHANLKVMGSSS